MNEPHQNGAAPILKSGFSGGRALIVAAAKYEHIKPLPAEVLNDALDIEAILLSSEHCGYDPNHVRLLLDRDASLENLRQALDVLTQSQPDDTVVIFFS